MPKLTLDFGRGPSGPVLRVGEIPGPTLSAEVDPQTGEWVLLREEWGFDDEGGWLEPTYERVGYSEIERHRSLYDVLTILWEWQEQNKD